MTDTKFLKIGDILIIAVCLLIALAIFVFSLSSEAVEAQIISEGEKLYEIKLDSVKESYEINLENGVTILVESDGISFIDSDCSGKNCILCGKLTKAGQAAYCLPNETLIKLTGEKNNKNPDAVSY